MSERPRSTQASLSRTPKPPAPVMIATFSPSGSGSIWSARDQSSSSFKVWARTTPDWMNAAS